METIKAKLDVTPFQTAGPFLHIGCMPNKIKINNLYESDLGEIPFKNKHDSKMITVKGSVFDGNGIALDDVMLESWQSDENGQFLEGNGFARFVPDNLTKKFKLITVKPGQIENLENRKYMNHPGLKHNLLLVGSCYMVGQQLVD